LLYAGKMLPDSLKFGPSYATHALPDVIAGRFQF